jgi:hypothetical protein
MDQMFVYHTPNDMALTAAFRMLHRGDEQTHTPDTQTENMQTHSCIHTHTHTCAHTHTRAHTHTHTHTHKHTYTHLQSRKHTNPHTNARTIRTYTHVYTHARTECTYKCKQLRRRRCSRSGWPQRQLGCETTEIDVTRYLSHYFLIP